MPRKHAKKFSQPQAVDRVVVQPAVYTKERVAMEVPEGTEGAMGINQDDGSVKWFVVGFKVAVPEVVKFVASGPTTTKGKLNTGGTGAGKKSAQPVAARPVR